MSVKRALKEVLKEEFTQNENASTRPHPHFFHETNKREILNNVLVALQAITMKISSLKKDAKHYNSINLCTI